MRVNSRSQEFRSQELKLQEAPRREQILASSRPLAPTNHHPQTGSRRLILQLLNSCNF